MDVFDAAKEVGLQPEGNGGRVRITFPQWFLLVLIVGGIGVNSIGMWRLFEWVWTHEREEGRRVAASVAFVERVEQTTKALEVRIDDLTFDTLVTRMILRQKHPETASAIEDMLNAREHRQQGHQ